MIELYLSKVNESSETEQAGKLYARVSYKETLNVQAMAKHMAEHNTMFSEGSITGILIDFVKCVREQVLMGNTVKIDNLAIFKATVEANGLETMYDANADKVAQATIGTLAEDAKTGPAVKAIKLLAQSTGDFTREELKKSVKFSWTDKAASDIAAAKAAAQGSGSNGGGSNGSGNSGSGSSTGSESGSEAVTAPEISGTSPFTDSTQVTIQGPQGAALYYTTDGSTPTSESMDYSEPITLSATTTVKAIAILNGETSAVASKTFTKSGESGGFDLGN
ncbi:MAG: chitobiase/beta-hexosaminidase C-terminal domain-containing protein [Prevotella sp.]|nr:chitobiase/beta-hexosaminidase C-terminal domain-containing protein [Prevotella sp.]